MFVTDNMSKFARSSKNCEKLDKSQFLLKLIKSSVTGGTRVSSKNCDFSKNCEKIEEIPVFAKIITSQRVDFNGKAVRAHFGQSNFSFFQQKRKKEILLRSVHISANLIFHFSNKNGHRKYYLSLSYLHISKYRKKEKKRKWSGKSIIFSFF